MPDSFLLWGVAISTNVAIMMSYLTVTLIMICFGGQVTLMVTDCVEGVFSHLVYLVILGVIFSIVSWQQVVDVLTGILPAGAPEGAGAAMAIARQHSLIDPFDAFEVKDFNFYATLLGIFGTVYACGAWQGGTDSGVRRFRRMKGGWRAFWGHGAPMPGC